MNASTSKELSFATKMALLQGKITTSPIADIILASIKPHWPGSYVEAIKVQGNWPKSAMWGVCKVTNHRSFYNNESQSNHYFNSKEEMEEWVASIDHDPEDFAVKLWIYEWDLGPQYRDLLQLS